MKLCDGAMLTLVLVASAVVTLMMGCASAREVKRYPDVLARLSDECNSGKQSSCVDLAQVRKTCTEHVAFLAAYDASNCASAVRKTDKGLQSN